MLRISQLKLPADHTPEQLKKKLLKAARLKESGLLEFQIRKRSLDARKKPERLYVYTVDFAVRDEEAVLRRAGGKITKVLEKPYQIPEAGEERMAHRPVIAGSGPAGLFCAYLLALSGYCPLVIERGAPVRERQADVERFWETGVLDPSSNVQFGEGGAGTFSDGKLNTLVKDSCGRNRFVLETFVEFGAPEEILWEQKPHIGTDVLIRVVEAIRNRITELGGEFRFHTQVTDLLPDDRQIRVVENAPDGTPECRSDASELIPADALVLAVGHSARDTFEMLLDRGVFMEPKDFAVGVRIEHPQREIDQAMYGREERGSLPAAAYKLAEKLPDGRGVYTFCMCPGGYVVNASSEPGRLAVNGMSYHGRAGENANSAVIVTVTKEDFGSDHPLAGVRFQRELEERAWKAGEGKVPVQRFGDFCRNVPSQEADFCGDSSGAGADLCRGSSGTGADHSVDGSGAGEALSGGRIRPNIKGGWRPGDVRGIFPEEIGDSLEAGIHGMGRKIRGFDDLDALLSGVESRTSSPVRIRRNGEFQSNIPWVYPCGEGAGYAGGITSASMDGMKVAEALIRQYAPFSGLFTKI